MKTKLLIASLFIGLFALLLSCEKFGEVKFNMNSADIIINVPADTIIGAGEFGQQSVKMNIDSVLEKNGVKRDKLKSVKLKSATLTVIDPVGANFDAIEYFDAQIGTSSLSMISIASLNPVPTDASEVSLTITDKEMLDYILSDEFTFILIGSKNQPILAPMKIKAKLSFECIGDVLK